MKVHLSRAVLGLSLTAAVFGTLVAPPSAVAQEVEGARSATGSTAVTFDVVERPLKDIVAHIQEKTDVNLILATDAEDVPVTVRIKNLPWREALDVVAEKAGCQLDERSANLIRIERPPRVGFEFKDAEVREVIQAVASIANANIVVGQEVTGRVTLSLHDVPWRVALETIVMTLGYTVVQEERGILRIVDPANLREQLETRVFTLRYVRPASPYRPKIESDVHEGNISAPGTNMSDIEKEFNLLAAFKQAVGSTGSVTYLKETNALIATGTKPHLDQLEELIGRIDIEPAQVYVDVKFVSTSNTDILNLGIDPGTGGVQATMDFGSMVHRLPFSLGNGGFEDSISAFRGTGGDKYGPLPLTNSGQAFQFGTLDFSRTTLALNLIKSDSSSKIVQAPKLIALDNQEATIFVGETIRYAKTTASSNQSGGLEFSIEEADHSPVQTGFQLLMIPHVIPDRDQVMMTIIPQQRSLFGPEDGFRRFTSGDQTILLPQERSSTVVTNMKLDNGQTAVIGGLLQTSEADSVNKIPFLGDIPLVGYLFRGEQSTETEQHLIIFITPQIVRDSRQMRDLVLDELRQRQDRIEEELIDIHGSSLAEPAGGAAPVRTVRPGMSGPR